jgi:methionyl-tRNA formyltransferase
VAADRDIGTWVLDFLLTQGVRPLALMVAGEHRASHAEALIAACPFLNPDLVFRGIRFREPSSVEQLRRLNLDYIVGIHFPYVVPKNILAIPGSGFLNLHPAFLPFNRGWHTPSWAILENTPIGATLHFMDEKIDTGDIVYQKRLEVSPGDTAHTLYQRLKKLELETFIEAWPRLAAGDFQRLPQGAEAGSVHNSTNLLQESVQRLDLHRTESVADLLRTLRALTTNRIDEAAYYEVDDRRYRVQVIIHEE